MNITLDFNYLFNNVNSFKEISKETPFSFLNSPQCKKILLLASALFGLIAAGYALHSYFHPKSSDSPLSPLLSSQETNEEAAAIKIQSVFRGHLARQGYKNRIQERAEERIRAQEHIREAQERSKKIKELEQQLLQDKQQLEKLKEANEKEQLLKKQKKEQKEQQKMAAVKIQTVCRDHLARMKLEIRRRQFLDDALFEKAKLYVKNDDDDVSLSEDLPMACKKSSSTAVYLSTEPPVVFKFSGSTKSAKRFEDMFLSREICEKNHYSHLIIPKARVYKKKLIIEQRLPVGNLDDDKGQIGLYIENRQLFTQAIQQFTAFACQTFLGDIAQKLSPYQSLSKFPTGRYDNFPLYIESEQGQLKGNIGLIDLEEGYFDQARKKSQSSNTFSCFEQCRDIICLFPHHFEEIIQTVKNFDPDIETSLKKLEEVRNGILQFFKRVYEDHLDFVRKKGISIDNPNQLFTISEEREKELQKACVSFLFRERMFYISILEQNEENVEEAIENFEKKFPKILNLIINFLSNALNEKSKKAKTPISTNDQLLAHRTLIFDIQDEQDDFETLFQEVKQELTVISFKNELAHNGLVLDLIEGVFKEFVKGQEIACYNHRYEKNSGAKYLFC